MSSQVVEPEVEPIHYAEPKKVSRFTRWYRSPLFNVIIVGLISFTQPGIWNALNSTYHIILQELNSRTLYALESKGEQTTKGSWLPCNVLLYLPVALSLPTFNLDSFCSVLKYRVSVMPVLTIPQIPAQAANKNLTS
jgi:hypothetical protein